MIEILRHTTTRTIICYIFACIGSAIVVLFGCGVALARDPQTHDYSAALMKPGPLPDVVIGDGSAPVTIVEYSSMTCGHCAKFHVSVLPALVDKYVKSGRARLISRSFPLNQLDAAATLLVRCASPAQRYPLKKALFKNQRSWMSRKADKVAELVKLTKPFGFTKQSFGACLNNKELFAQVSATRQVAIKSLDVTGTPTVFVNGKMMIRGISSDTHLKGGILMKGPLPPGGNVKPVYIMENSLAGLTKAIDAAN